MNVGKWKPASDLKGPEDTHKLLDLTTFWVYRYLESCIHKKSDIDTENAIISIRYCSSRLGPHQHGLMVESMLSDLRWVFCACVTIMTGVVATRSDLIERLSKHKIIQCLSCRLIEFIPPTTTVEFIEKV